MKSTWIQAVKNSNFHTCPGLIQEVIQKYYPIAAAAAKIHLDQGQKNLRSTNPNFIPPSKLDEK